MTTHPSLAFAPSAAQLCEQVWLKMTMTRPMLWEEPQKRSQNSLGGGTVQDNLAAGWKTNSLITD